MDLDLTTERRLDEADRHLGQHILTVALEPLVTLDVEHDVEMTDGATQRGLTLTGEPQGLTVIDANRHGDVERRGLKPQTAAVAVLAQILDRLASAAAVRTRDLHHEETLNINNLTLTLTNPTNLKLTTQTSAVATADRAGDLARDLDILNNTPHHLNEDRVRRHPQHQWLGCWVY